MHDSSEGRAGRPSSDVPISSKSSIVRRRRDEAGHRTNHGWLDWIWLARELRSCRCPIITVSIWRRSVTFSGMFGTIPTVRRALCRSACHQNTGQTHDCTGSDHHKAQTIVRKRLCSKQSVDPESFQDNFGETTAVEQRSFEDLS